MNPEQMKAEAECMKPVLTSELITNVAIGAASNAAVVGLMSGGTGIAPAAVGGGLTAGIATVVDHVRDIKDCVDNVKQEFKQKQEDSQKQVAPQQTAPQTPPPTPAQQHQQQKPPMVIARRLQQGDRGYVGGNFNFNGRMARGGLSYRF